MNLSIEPPLTADNITHSIPVDDDGRFPFGENWRRFLASVDEERIEIAVASLQRGAMIALHTPYLLAARYLKRALTGRMQPERGMSPWHDMLDWLGGYPFEVARPEKVVDRPVQRGFKPLQTFSAGRRHGCNEFILKLGTDG